MNRLRALRYFAKLAQTLSFSETADHFRDAVIVCVTSHQRSRIRPWCGPFCAHHAVCKLDRLGEVVFGRNCTCAAVSRNCQ